MEKINQIKRKTADDFVNSGKIKESLLFAVSHEEKELFSKLGTTINGLSDEQVKVSREENGNNVVTHGKVNPLFKRIFNAFINPFTAILFVLAIVSVFTDIVLVTPGERNYVTVIIITTMVMISGILRFVQETRSCNAAAQLQNMICTTACVERAEQGKNEIPLDDIVVGDIVHLSAGDLIPADARILSAKDLFVSQSVLTGESEPIEKLSIVCDKSSALADIHNLAFMGSTVISGSAKAVVAAVGNNTLLGGMAKTLNEKPPKTSFEKGVNAVSWILIRFMLIMVPVVLFVNGFTKGAVEEMLKCCAYAEFEGKVTPLTDEVRCFIMNKADELNGKGMRVLAVAHKTNPAPVGQFSVEDESEMVLIGFLALLDPPKPTTESAIPALNEHGIEVKILTGDNDKVTQSIAKQVGLKVNEVMLGSDLDSMTDKELSEKAEHITVFAKLSPEQKARVVHLLRENGHSVGYMGDGINDAIAMKTSDVGISVDTAVDIAKESADVILLEKDLNVLEDGIIEGRKTYANMIKYIKMTASSNFGNMFSVLTASAFLPFLPMEALHLIFLNLIYDLSCTAVPWDNVDTDFLKKPRKWDASSVSKFMLWIGPTSSVFDIATYLLMYFIICPIVCGGQMFHQITDPAMQTLYISVFQSGWFVESMWSQTLVIHMIRTPKIPFIQSRASLPVTLLTFAGIGIVTLIPFTSLGSILGFSALPAIYFIWLTLIIASYMVLATLIKRIYIRRYGELL